MQTINIKNYSLAHILAIIFVSLLLSLIFTNNVYAQTSIASLTDVKETDWFYSDVNWAVESNLFSGISKNKFAPNKNITRAEFVVALHRLEGQPEPGTLGQGIKNAHDNAGFYKDVKKGDWYYRAFDWAAQTDIVRGSNATTKEGIRVGYFHPNDAITREELAIMLWRYARVYKGYWPQERSELDEFSDVASGKAKFSSYSGSANGLAWAVAKDIIKGRENNRLEPQGKSTRAEVATIFHRYLTAYPEKK